MARITKLDVNGTIRTVDAEESTSLLTVLREQLELTGTKYGCGEGQCGACTVLIDGTWSRSCITRVGLVTQKKITTIEGLASAGRLHPLQQAFLDEGAMQCAYCTSGMIMTAFALLNQTADPSDGQIAEFMEGNICRCGTYPRIIRAIKRAAISMKGSSASKEARS